MDFDSTEIIEIANDPNFYLKMELMQFIRRLFFPDTYFFFEGDTPKSVLSHLISKYKDFWNKTYRDRAKKLNMNENEVVTLASIIEGEAIYNSERAKDIRSLP